MKALYLSTPVRDGLGPCLRPGGLALTERVLELLKPQRDSLILDAGCGPGGSMAMLGGKGYGRLVGCDLHGGLLAEARQAGQSVMRADLAQLPLATGCLDTVLCECAWNLTDRLRVAAEFARVLRPGGHLALSDIFARPSGLVTAKTSWPLPSCFAGATDLATVRSQVTAAGFTIIHLEDHSQHLRRTAAEFVFAHGSLHAFWQAVTGQAASATAACQAAAALRPGLFLLIARRL